MSQRTAPPFRADHVGSLLRPPRLRAAREQLRRNAISAAELREIEDAAVREVVRLQEEIGLAAVTDGEFRRDSWARDFLESFAGVSLAPSQIKVRFHTEEGEIEAAPPGMRVTARLARPRPIVLEPFRFLASVARAVPKVTIPSPSMLHFRGGRAAIDAEAYPEMDQFYADLARVYAEEIADLAAAGCRYLQIDETNLAYLCDESLRRQVRSNIGEDPAALPLLYAKLINAAIAARPPEMAVCLHLCRGNNQSAWIAEGGYEPVAEVLFNAIDVAGYFLEYDSPRAGDFAPLRFVPKGKIVVLGLVTTKRPQLESKEALKRRIDEAARYLPLEQLALSPQCGFSSTAEGNKLTIADELAKLRRVVEVAQEVWG